MAIFYCDPYNGLDSNNGLTETTPKKSLSGCTNLCTTKDDIIKVRGLDNYATNLGTMTWINGTLTITGSTDLTSTVSGYTYIFKSTDTTPIIYKIASYNWNSGTSTFTITLSLSNGNYEGTTETCGVMGLNLPSPTGIMSTNKAGFRSGTDTLWYTRTNCQIIGGWNSDYTAVTGYTIVYQTTNTVALSIAHDWWSVSNFIVIGGTVSTLKAGVHQNIAYADGNGTNMTGSFTALFNISSVVNNITGYPFTISTVYASGITAVGGHSVTQFLYCCEIYNSTIINTKYWGFGNFTSSIFENCFIKTNNTSYGTFNGCKYTVVSGCTLYNNPSGKLFYNCSSMKVLNNNLYTGSSTIIERSDGLFINSGIDTFLNMNYSDTSVIDCNSNGITIPTSGLFFGTDFYGTITNSYVVHNFNDLFYVDVQCGDETKSVMLYNYGYVKQTNETYSGTTGLRCGQYVNNSECRLGTVDFWLTSGNSYQLSFYVKSSNNQNFDYNFYLMDSLILSSWVSGTTSSSTWTNYTYDINNVPKTGTIRLFIKFNSGAGHYIDISDILLTQL